MRKPRFIYPTMLVRKKSIHGNGNEVKGEPNDMKVFLGGEMEGAEGFGEGIHQISKNSLPLSYRAVLTCTKDLAVRNKGL